MYILAAIDGLLGLLIGMQDDIAQNIGRDGTYFWQRPDL